MTTTYNPQDVKVFVNGVVIDGLTINSFEVIKPDTASKEGIGLGESLEGWDG